MHNKMDVEIQSGQDIACQIFIEVKIDKNKERGLPSL
jgi:hypothetical protein